MQLLNNYNITNDASENEMQEQVDKFLREQKFTKFNGYYFEKVDHITLREFRIPEIGRISDHVVLINNRRVVNFECKLKDVAGVISQAIDHLRWADYSLIIVPPDSTYITHEYLYKIMKNGIGLIYWFKDIGLFEFILPKFNRNKDKDLRSKLINRINEQTSEIKLQLTEEK